jgi:hypothetical protein
MHHKKLKIVDSFNITNRGRVIVTDLIFDEHISNFSKGDTFRREDKILEIISVEAILKIEDGNYIDYLSFIVKEISAKELFVKEFKPRHDASVMKDIERRIKYRWFIRRKQKFILRFLVLRDKVISFFKP